MNTKQYDCYSVMSVFTNVIIVITDNFIEYFVSQLVTFHVTKYCVTFHVRVMVLDKHIKCSSFLSLDLSFTFNERNFNP